MNLLTNSILTRIDEGKPRLLPYRLKWRRPHDAIYGFDLKLAKDEGLIGIFWKTFSKALKLKDSMLAD